MNDRTNRKNTDATQKPRSGSVHRTEPPNVKHDPTHYRGAERIRSGMQGSVYAYRKDKSYRTSDNRIDTVGKRRCSDYTPRPEKANEVPKKTKILRYTFIGIAALLVIAIGAVAVYSSSLLGKINYMSEEELAVPKDVENMVLEEIDVVSSADTITDEEMNLMDEEISAAVVDENGLISQEGVTNILVLGIDTREKQNVNKTRSDVMIILSINENTKQIVMSSLMRDIYVSIPGRRYPEKLTHANAYGGPALTKQTIEGAFGIKIDHFVLVNFYAFIDVIDALGGITLDIDESERKVMNRYVGEINRHLGLDKDNGKLQHSGNDILLTGKQALGYVRNRYSKGGDYERTSRQREVLQLIIERAKTASASQLLAVVDAAAGNMATDYTQMEIVGLAADAVKYIDYEIEQLRIPIEGTYSTGIKNGIWRMDIRFAPNREALYTAIFGEGYTGQNAQ